MGARCSNSGRNTRFGPKPCQLIPIVAIITKSGTPQLLQLLQVLEFNSHFSPAEPSLVANFSPGAGAGAAGPRGAVGQGLRPRGRDFQVPGAVSTPTEAVPLLRLLVLLVLFRFLLFFQSFSSKVACSLWPFRFLHLSCHCCPKWPTWTRRHFVPPSDGQSKSFGCPCRCQQTSSPTTKLSAKLCVCVCCVWLIYIWWESTFYGI